MLGFIYGPQYNPYIEPNVHGSDGPAILGADGSSYELRSIFLVSPKDMDPMLRL